MKKLRLATILLLLITAFGISSCGLLQQGIEPRNPEDKTFDVKNFDKLEMGSAFHINVRQGANYKINVHGDSRDIDDLIVKEVEGELKVYYSKWRIRRYRMEIDIEMPTVKEIDFSGASTSKVEGFNNLNELEIDLSGSSRATFITRARLYEIDLSGASELDIEGSAQEIEVDLSGSSQLNAFDMTTEKATLDVSGASTSRVNVTRQLSVRASGASKVRYRGNPQISSNLSGSSKVERERD